ncbi:hypothetical protein BDN72DRAFT_487746 [Pluteus cervinus]|uniref:Uncharacterized protein n=1 Tax=Pluteus cervinus TaxID=181527 RepID=A0ACD3AZ60_9AGAR|nr:hypothetical protein BDN72DRAFT_487746 [Pluteus cervinus]
MTEKATPTPLPKTGSRLHHRHHHLRRPMTSLSSSFWCTTTQHGASRQSNSFGLRHPEGVDVVVYELGSDLTGKTITFGLETRPTELRVFSTASAQQTYSRPPSNGGDTSPLYSTSTTRTLPFDGVLAGCGLRPHLNDRPTAVMTSFQRSTIPQQHDSLLLFVVQYLVNHDIQEQYLNALGPEVMCCRVIRR